MKNRIYIFIFIIMILFEVGFLLKSSIHYSSEKLSADIPDYLSSSGIIAERDRWSKIIDEVGPEKAYKEFKEQYANKSFGTQHTAAHIIGALLYKKAGIKGQTICDSTFAFGCYHSFFTSIISNEGLEIVPRLDKVCVDKFGPLGSGCQHGIGHGIMDYFGPKHLVDALEACKETTASSPISGCTSGVFMEYNVPVIVNETSAISTSRPIDKKNPYDPCPSLPQKFQESCYYSIGQWWSQTGLYRDNWSAMGLLCKNVPDSSHIETCYLGIGNIIAPENKFEPEDTIADCKKMPDKRGIILCQAGASWSFDANPQFKDLAVKMCRQLVDVDKKECQRIGHLLNPSNQ